MLCNAGNWIRWAGFAVLVYGIYIETLLWLPGLVVSIIGSGLMTTPVVKVARMDDYYLWISGVDQGYLASLPPVHG
jgi:hypothetical protein